MKLFTLCILFAILSQKSDAQDWLTSGNTGITTSNFIGTIDNADLIFKTNNVERGRLLKKGPWRFGKGANYATFDNGSLSFTGNATYKVGDSQYVFQLASSANYGLFFNK